MFSFKGLIKSHFEYTPIDPATSSFRLLRLFKGRRYYNDDPLQAELYEAPLPKENECDDTYEALSYTWGDPNATKSMLLNGFQVFVTTNLHDALSHLRGAEEDRILWVDALCINQQDSLERTHQVDKMSFIYKKAARVIIWLGSTDRHIDLLLDAIDQLDRRMRRCPIPSNADRLELLCNEGRGLLRELAEINPVFHMIRKKALEELLNRPWFRRVWVVQEAANASRAIIQCSWTPVSTRYFAIMPSLMGLTVDSRSQAMLDVMPGPLRQSSWWNTDRNLHTVLQKFSQLQSTDPRDQIFGLLGLLDYPRTKSSLRPDYQIGLHETIQRTVSFLAFGQVLQFERRTLPLWNLEELREKLPSLRQSLFEWALCENENGISVAQNLTQDDHRIDVNDQLITFKEYPLHFVISRKGPVEMIEILLQREDLDVNQSQDGMRPMDLAAKQGHVDVIEALLTRKDLDIHLQVQTATAHAVEEGHEEAISTLLSRAESLGDPPVGYKTSLLFQAVRLGRSSVVALLLETGANHDFLISNDTLLLEAVRERQVDIVKMLIEKRASINVPDSFSGLALSIAARNCDLELLKVLVDAGADVKAFGMIDLMTWWNSHFHTFGVEVRKQKLRITNFLIRRGAEIHSGGNQERYDTPLSYAARCGDLGMVKLLIKSGADPTICEELPNWSNMALEISNPLCMDELSDYWSETTERVPASSKMTEELLNWLNTARNQGEGFRYISSQVDHRLVDAADQVIEQLKGSRFVSWWSYPLLYFLFYVTRLLFNIFCAPILAFGWWLLF